MTRRKRPPNESVRIVKGRNKYALTDILPMGEHSKEVERRLFNVLLTKVELNSIGRLCGAMHIAL